jgi:hypothetical protein
LSRSRKSVELVDARTKAGLGAVEVYWHRRIAQIRLPKFPRLHLAFLKITHRKIFFDRNGWLSVPIYQRANRRTKEPVGASARLSG